jgi:hypothetical protein
MVGGDEMKDCVPIKVKIGLRPNGHADHPNWNLLPLAATDNPATHMYYGWKYDKTSGHEEEGPDSPVGMQWGMIMVSQTFATQAVATFPAIVSVLTEAEAQDFWDTRAHAHLPENRVNSELIADLNSEFQLRTASKLSTTVLEAKIIKALDPDDPEPGIIKDKTKKWVDAKTTLGINVKTIP